MSHPNKAECSANRRHEHACKHKLQHDKRECSKCDLNLSLPQNAQAQKLWNPTSRDARDAQRILLLPNPWHEAWEHFRQKQSDV